MLFGGACAQEPVDASKPRFLADEVSGAGAVALADQSRAARPPCLESGEQVVALGDSYVASPLLLVSKIEHLARADGALQRWDRYRDYAVGGSTLGNPDAWGSIPPQWLQAKADDDDIHVVIMDGGGNDLLDSGCLVDGASAKPSCIDVVN
ncbi:MAG TPA: hypothetical protein VG963_04365, partial [Polyangiaceae bacterium]|nr:hypothetical protein [Polyangiaceae bacterium]